MDKLTIEYGGGLFELADEEGLGEKLLSVKTKLNIKIATHSKISPN